MTIRGLLELPLHILSIALLNSISVWRVYGRSLSISSSGKLKLPGPFREFLSDQLRQNMIETLPISFEHIARTSTLLFHHRDPFDRIIIAQALSEGWPIVSNDIAFDAYGVTRVW